MPRQVDLLGQYISLILIPRLNRADELESQGRYYEATRKQLSVVRVLYRQKEEQKEQLKVWMKYIDEIDEKSRLIKGNTADMRKHNMFMFKNRNARNLYNKLDWVIWNKLHGLGYFDKGNKYGPKISEYDSEKGEEI